MDTEGTHGTARNTEVPRPAGPPAVPPGSAPWVPPLPAHAPGTGPALAEWLRAPRPDAEPGVWRQGHVPRPAEQSDSTPDRALASGAAISFLACVLLWSLLENGYIPYWDLLPKLFTPRGWWELGRPEGHAAMATLEAYRLMLTGLLLYGFGRLGSWRIAFDRLVAERGRGARVGFAAATAVVTFALVQSQVLPVHPLAFSHLPYEKLGMTSLGAVGLLLYCAIYLPLLWFVARLAGWTGRRTAAAPLPPVPSVPSPEADPAGWSPLRAAGLGDVADRLAGEAASGRMNDVDYVRIRRAWQSVQADPTRLRAFGDAVRERGAGACVHPSTARDLPVRAARHDLVVRQVRIGTVDPGARNPYPRRGTGLALDPDVLGTSLVAVGPSGAGKTRRLVRPVVESLALQALAGQAAVIAVAAAGTPLGPDEAYDVVVRIGDPASVYDLDLYGGTTDPDEAAALLAEGLAGEAPGEGSRRAATVLAQLLGPFRAAHGRFPAVPELRELLDGGPAAHTALRTALQAAGEHAMLRELDARERQAGSAADPAALLADRIALLDRPAFAGFFDTSGRGRPFSLRSLEHPLRVRIDLPERGHAEASRMLARLLLAQFTAGAAARTDRSLFACLVLDDAAHTLTAETVRAVQRLRSAHAGVVLPLRTLDDVPEQLRTPLFGAVGCRMAFSGVTTWDGKRFAEAWGTEWVEARDVTSRTVYADQPLTRMVNSFRKLVTGKAVTTDAVTVRQVERERWSASELAHAVPAGHAVLSLTSVRGERTPPLLVDLDG
ncbi:ATP/GTP-binding protein [Streptomyces bambusae]|uniref:ATP/GTP-binding protein n=1 Tax=Streptomyces bambusae TaxID=1550616 RepID=UPI001CFFA77B|nr:ATP/GTP-binding protein [Streptomyces bambusae]MCB5170052.1 ATP/GTP-binding protein [Streptomyces bambusae]